MEEPAREYVTTWEDLQGSVLDLYRCIVPGCGNITTSYRCALHNGGVDNFKTAMSTRPWMPGRKIMNVWSDQNGKDIAVIYKCVQRHCRNCAIAGDSFCVKHARLN